MEPKPCTVRGVLYGAMVMDDHKYQNLRNRMATIGQLPDEVQAHVLGHLVIELLDHCRGMERRISKLERIVEDVE